MENERRLAMGAAGGGVTATAGVINLNNVRELVISITDQIVSSKRVADMHAGDRLEVIIGVNAAGRQEGRVGFM